MQRSNQIRRDIGPPYRPRTLLLVLMIPSYLFSIKLTMRLAMYRVVCRADAFAKLLSVEASRRVDHEEYVCFIYPIALRWPHHIVLERALVCLSFTSGERLKAKIEIHGAQQ